VVQPLNVAVRHVGAAQAAGEHVDDVGCALSRRQHLAALLQSRRLVNERREPSSDHASAEARKRGEFGHGATGNAP
jgi:hypothetical protein